MGGKDLHEPRRTLTTGEAARALGVAQNTVRGMCERGEFKGAVRIGNWWRIPESAVREYLPGEPEPA